MGGFRVAAVAKIHTASMNVRVNACSHSGWIPDGLGGELLSERGVQRITTPHSRAV